MGRRLIPQLLQHGFTVRALVRPGSETKLSPGCEPVRGDVLNSESYIDKVFPAETFVHLVGVSHPNPSKAQRFRSIDLVSLKASVEAAVQAGCRHFVFVSVAQPAPVMKAYLEVRAESEQFIRAAGINATILRPWYVLGPGHRWPYALLPVYWILERLPSTRESAMRLGLVTIDQMVRALVKAVNEPATGVRIVTVPEIRQA